VANNSFPNFVSRSFSVEADLVSFVNNGESGLLPANIVEIIYVPPTDGHGSHAGSDPRWVIFCTLE
jgi:hypothetical protein